MFNIRNVKPCRGVKPSRRPVPNGPESTCEQWGRRRQTSRAARPLGKLFCYFDSDATPRNSNLSEKPATNATANISS
jgi:hypothetical protein